MNFKSILKTYKILQFHKKSLTQIQIQFFFFFGVYFRQPTNWNDICLPCSKEFQISCSFHPCRSQKITYSTIISKNMWRRTCKELHPANQLSPYTLIKFSSPTLQIPPCPSTALLHIKLLYKWDGFLTKLASNKEQRGKYLFLITLQVDVACS